MKTRDIPTKPILELLAGESDGWFQMDSNGFFPAVSDAMPPGTPRKLRLSKMRNLLNRRLVTGCACGCRGDFMITKAGLSYLRKLP